MPSIMVKRRAPTEPARDAADTAAAAAAAAATDDDDAAAASSTEIQSASKKPRIYPHDAQCPSITATTIKALKWGDSRELISPFLNDQEKASIHKLTRSQLSELVDARVIAGDVTPQQFWAVVGTDKVRQQKNKQKDKPLDPVVAEALMKKSHNIAVMGSSPVDARASLPQPHHHNKASSMPLSKNSAAGTTGASFSSLPHPKPPIPYLPGMPMAPAPKPAPNSSGGGGGGGGGNLVRPPFMPLPRPQYKYVLRKSFATGNSSGGGSANIPSGIVIGEPIPPNPFTPPSVSGTFYSSALLAFDGKVIHPGKATQQMEYLYNTLIILLSQVNSTLSDILNMTVHVVDIERNGNDVLTAHGKFMREMDGSPCTPCAYTMTGVSALMRKGCVVQIQVTAVVRRGLMANLTLDSRSSSGSNSRRPIPTAAAAPPPGPTRKTATAMTPAVTKKKKATNRPTAPAAPVEKRGRGRPKKTK